MSQKFKVTFTYLNQDKTRLCDGWLELLRLLAELKEDYVYADKVNNVHIEEMFKD